MEIWKEIKGYESLYQVSSFGRVRSLDRLVIYKDGKKRFWKGQILKQMTQKTGYKTVNLSKKGIQKYKFIHHLVAENFMDHIVSRKMHIDHIDNTKDNNRLDNLQVLSHRKNISKSDKKKTSQYPGVYFIKNRLGTKKWVAQIGYNKKRIHLGYFYTENEAKLAYENKFKTLLL